MEIVPSHPTSAGAPKSAKLLPPFPAGRGRELGLVRGAVLVPFFPSWRLLVPKMSPCSSSHRRSLIPSMGNWRFLESVVLTCCFLLLPMSSAFVVSSRASSSSSSSSSSLTVKSSFRKGFGTRIQPQPLRLLPETTAFVAAAAAAAAEVVKGEGGKNGVMDFMESDWSKVFAQIIATTSLLIVHSQIQGGKAASDSRVNKIELLSEIKSISDRLSGDLKGSIGDMKGSIGEVKGTIGEVRGSFQALESKTDASLSKMDESRSSHERDKQGTGNLQGRP